MLLAAVVAGMQVHVGVAAVQQAGTLALARIADGDGVGLVQWRRDRMQWWRQVEWQHL